FACLWTVTAWTRPGPSSPPSSVTSRLKVRRKEEPVFGGQGLAVPQNTAACDSAPVRSCSLAGAHLESWADGLRGGCRALRLPPEEGSSTWGRSDVHGRAQPISYLQRSGVRGWVRTLLLGVRARRVPLNEGHPGRLRRNAESVCLPPSGQTWTPGWRVARFRDRRGRRASGGRGARSP